MADAIIASGAGAPIPTKNEAPSSAYVPNKTLGCSGYVDSPVDRLPRVLAQLHALLNVLYDPDIKDVELENSKITETGTFQRMNEYVQCEVLGLARDLAQEAHELHEQVYVYGEGGAQ